MADPTWTQERDRYGRALRALKKFSRPTRAETAKVVAAHAVRSVLRLGELAAARGLKNAATRCYELAARADSPQVPAYARLESMRANLLLARFGAAFDIAEGLLDSRPSARTLEGLSNRLGGDPRDPVVAPALLRKLTRYASRHADDPWPVTLLIDVLHKLGRRRQALLLGERLARFPRRYWWMRYPYGWMLLLDRCDLAGAEKEFKAVAKSWPAFWQARAHLAETRLCRGRHAEAFRLFDRLLDGLSGADLAQAVTWRGELYLWAGRYRRALADLEKGVLGGAPFALAWRGAAKMLLGKPREGLEDLDEHLRLHVDLEAQTWRGECRRRAGLVKEALRDFSALLAGADNPWARMNRAPILLRLGKNGAALADYGQLPKAVRDWLGPGPLEPALERGLKRARGVRRTELYLRPLWMAAALFVAACRPAETAAVASGYRPPAGVSVGLDPRVQLLSAVQALASPSAPGADALVDAYRGRLSVFREHPAVLRYAKWMRDGVPAAAPMQALLLASTAYALAAPLETEPWAVGALGGEDAVRNFVSELRDLDARSGLGADRRFRAEENRLALEEALEKYMGARYTGRYRLVIAPDYRADEGPSKAQHWSEDGVILVLFRRAKTAEQSSYGLAQIGRSLAHELDASVGPPPDSCGDAAAAGGWQHCLDEHVVLAVESRLLALTGADPGDISHLIENFPHLPALVESLRGYEKERDLYPTLDRYYPRLIAVVAEGSRR